MKRDLPQNPQERSMAVVCGQCQRKIVVPAGQIPVPIGRNTPVHPEAQEHSCTCGKVYYTRNA